MIARVLRGEKNEGLRKREGVSVDGDIPFTHRLEQRGLRSGRGAIELVGQNDIGKDRTFVKDELVSRRVENLDADDVGGQEIARTLDPAHLEPQHFRDGFDDGRFSHPGNVFQKNVIGGKHRAHECVHQRFFALEKSDQRSAKATQ